MSQQAVKTEASFVLVHSYYLFNLLDFKLALLYVYSEENLMIINDTSQNKKIIGRIIHLPK